MCIGSSDKMFIISDPIILISPFFHGGMIGAAAPAPDGEGEMVMVLVWNIDGDSAFRPSDGRGGMASDSVSSVNVDPVSDGGSEQKMSSVTQLFPSIVELNVGGVFYTTSLATLTRECDSLLGKMFSGRSKVPVLRDAKGKFFIDRDGVLFRYILDFLRNLELVLPEKFCEKERLHKEAEYFDLKSLIKALHQRTQSIDTCCTSERTGCITVGYRGSFSFGKDGLAGADAKFRKMNKILVSGRITLCREVFGDTLNESRDPDRGDLDRYTARFFLKHQFLEQAFDMLCQSGFRLQGSCGSGTTATSSFAEKKPGVDPEEEKWNHYNEFVWIRD